MRQRYRNKKERARRVEEAPLRQALYDALLLQQKIDRTTERSFAGLGASRRETLRLINQVPEEEVLDELIGAAS